MDFDVYGFVIIVSIYCDVYIFEDQPVLIVYRGSKTSFLLYFVDTVTILSLGVTGTSGPSGWAVAPESFHVPADAPDEQGGKGESGRPPFARRKRVATLPTNRQTNKQRNFV